MVSLRLWPKAFAADTRLALAIAAVPTKARRVSLSGPRSSWFCRSWLPSSAFASFSAKASVLRSSLSSAGILRISFSDSLSFRLMFAGDEAEVGKGGHEELHGQSDEEQAHDADEDADDGFAAQASNAGRDPAEEGAS